MKRYRADEATVTVSQHGNGSRLLVSWRSEHFHAILGRFRADVVRVHADGSYAPAEKGWSVSLRARRRLEEWLARTFEPSAISWEDVGPIAYVVSNTSIEAAYAVLYLRRGAPPELVQAAHRIMARRCHPDCGGTHEQAVAVNAAITVIRQAQEQEGEGKEVRAS